MTNVLISIQPRWCELILSGKKTVEIRKTKPNIKMPFRCYIYCTKDNKYFLDDGKRRLNGKVIGEFVCTKIDRIQKRGINDNFDYCYLSLNVFGNDDIEIEITDIKKSCIKKDELNSYGSNSNVLYAWHISNLVIYDKPKELREFNFPHYRECDIECRKCKFSIPVKTILGVEYDCDRSVKRPPQSWCYVESLVS